MQHTEQELERPVSPAPTEPVSEYLTPEEADEIFRQAEAEIQPILRKMRKDRFIGWVQGVLCASLILFSMAGIVWQCLTYPHTLVVLYAKANAASITTTLDVPTRTLTPITITRSFTAPTTGHGHLKAQAATGTVTFYNGQNTPQNIPVGTVLTGQDGVKITTSEPALVPAANLPNVGVVTIGASAIQAGSQGNIAPYDINVALTSVLTVKNQTPFTHGRDARDFQAVGQQDIQSLTRTVQKTLETAFTTAFLLRPGEQAQPTNCHTTTTADHGLGQEAQSVTMKTSKTCSAMAYSQDELTKEATAAFRPLYKVFHLCL